MNKRYLSLTFLSLFIFLFSGITEAFSLQKQTKQHLSISKPININSTNFSVVVNFPGELHDLKPEDIQIAYKTAHLAGFKITNLYYNWGEIETKKQEYNWDELDYNIQLIKDNKLICSLVIKIIDTNKVGTLPTDLKFSSFNERLFVSRFKKFIISLLERYSQTVHYIWIGNEIDVFLFKHKKFIQDYIKFYKSTYISIKRRFPNIKIGVVFSYHDAKNNNALYLIQKVGRYGDIIGFSFYPQILKKADPSKLYIYFNEMLQISSKIGKKFAITETGWSSSGLNGSEESQADFIKKLFRVYANYKDDVEFLGLFVLYDFPESLNRSLAQSYGLSKFKEYLKFQGSLGFAYNNGTPKKSWFVLLEKLKKFK